MLKSLPIIIISSTIPLSDGIINLPQDYSIEAHEFLRRKEEYNSQDLSDLLYNLILEELEVDHKSPLPTID